MFEAIGGFFNLLMQPIYWAISGIIVGFHNLYSMVLDANSGWTWVLSIVSLTIVIRSLMIPLFVRQINSSRKMQLVAPKARALQEKYGQDRERYGQEVMKLYQEEGVNPAASCLPLLLQMPIFIGLFWVLNDAARGSARGYWFEQNPQLVDSLQHSRIFGAEISGTFLPMAAGFGPTQWVALFLIITMTGTLFWTQLQLMRKNMPPEALEGPLAQQQKMMLYLFPAIYLFTGVSFPIGVMIYWLASNLWTLGQQFILIRNNPTPNTPAFVDWQDRMRAKGKDPDEIIRQRTAKMRRGARPTPAASDPTKVTRQGTSRQTSAPAGESGGATAVDATQPQVVRRQQPTRQTRATRKQARPRPSGGSKE
ncbi:membrane protein insertase YidC [Propioniciclava soli]|uniref:membrane protein insertase YidC n=1 Tax=Propioniciclava soli TaxID=2775081 RepID=UPI002FCD2D1B